MTYSMTQLRELNVVGEEWSGSDLDLVQSRLYNISTLRVKEASVPAFFFSGMDTMELLDLSGNFYRLNILSVETCSSLETVIINGSTKLSYISLERCPKLKNIFLSGSLDNLHLIGIRGTAIETLNLSAMTAPELEILYLLDCEKLCAIIWPPAEDRRKTYLKRLHVDTTQTEGTTTLPAEHSVGRPLSKFDWHISASDARILKSLESIKDYFSPNHSHVEISSPSHHPYAADGGSKNGEMKSSSRQHVQVKLNQLIKNSAIYADVVDSDASAIMCVCPPPPSVPSQGCYIYIEDKMRDKLQTASTAIPAFICDSAKILHVHDSSHITSILATPLSSMTWNQLEWCRVERCLKLGCVFSPQLGEGREGRNNDMHDMFKNLRTIRASHLPKARAIWQWSGSSRTWLYGGTFEDLTFLHLDYCPRVIHIIHFPLVENALDRLETLEIMWCSDLSVAFHFYDTLWKSGSETGGWIFLKLKQIILHELPKLRNICNIGKKVYTPELETIKIRGCWSLRTLPIVESKNVVECNCEKEWWDMLELESAEHARKYKLTYPRHYKTTMLKGSVLR